MRKMLCIELYQSFRNRNMCTSLQNIMAFNDRHLAQKDIQQLFKPKNYPLFELAQFYSHQLHDNNQQFRFFVDVLDEWNRKVSQGLINNNNDTLLEKNMFINNSLRNIIMKPSNTSSLILDHLFRWFDTTRSHTIRIQEKKKKTWTEQDQDWQIRNTFKSNLPSEIDNYHRRIVCKSKDGKYLQKCDLFKGIGQQEKQIKLKTNAWTQKMDSQLERKRVAKIENEQICFQRQQDQLRKVGQRWKVKISRSDQIRTKDFFKSCFSSGKTYFHNKKKNLKENQPSSNTIAFRSIKTSANERVRNKSKDFTRILTQQGSTPRKSEAEDKFKEFDNFGSIRLSEITGLRLMDNPLQTKIKKKKKKKNK